MTATVEGLDLTPAAGAAPRGRRILRHAAIEASLLVRNGEQLLLALVIPFGLLIAGLVFGDRVGLDVAVFPASVLALALWSTTFTSLAISTGFERRYGVLERLVATPLTRGDLVTGKALANGAIALGQVVLLTVAAFALGWRPAPAALQIPIAVVAALLAVTTFACFALALAGRLRAEATLGLANLIYLLVAVGGGLVIPVAAHPAWAQPVLALLPSAALGESLRALASGIVAPLPLVVLAAWLVVALVLARKAFRWTS
ncbi:MAG: ABC transporter permease [Propioniciclava sp.]|uniref:ABC transporter permease n=1 Tax=Propioniciclava sp. TaxID=2038686 RepID=UPI0039E32ADA